MDWKLELVAIPVSDVDRAKAFYTSDRDHGRGAGIGARDADARSGRVTPPRLTP